MELIGAGGQLPFNTQTRPNIFTPVHPEEIIERRGESFYWFRMQPCPCDRNDTSSLNCRFCVDGQIPTHQESRRIIEETAWKVEGNKVYFRFGPIDRVESAVWTVADGKTVDLRILDTHPDHIEVNVHLKYWHSVNLSYYAKLSKELILNFEIEEITKQVFVPKIWEEGIVTKVHELYLDGQPIHDKVLGFNFDSIVFSENIRPGRISGKITVFQPIKLGYKTFELDQSETERVKFGLNKGQIAVVSPLGYKMGQGDILIMVKSDARHSERIKTHPARQFDFLSHSPVIRIHNLIVKTNRGLEEKQIGKDFNLISNDRIFWLSDKPNEYSIVYDYNPTFRVSGSIENGSLENRERPRILKADAIPTYRII
jgi:hypothetical protein